MTKNKCLFNFQFFYANNISLESSTLADFKNHIFKALVAELKSFQFRKFYSIRTHCSKKDTDCEGSRKRAEPRTRRVRGNSVVRYCSQVALKEMTTTLIFSQFLTLFWPLFRADKREFLLPLIELKDHWYLLNQMTGYLNRINISA